MKRKKILIIQGGGVFGCIPAHFLGMLPEASQTLEGVDMISGCSIGGILSLAYAAGRTFTEIDKVFQERVKDCFDKRWLAYINPLACPTYNTDGLDSVISEMIGDICMQDIRRVYPNLDVVIPALNVTADKYKVFDNIKEGDADVPLADIAGYTSAAPTYFEGRDFRGNCMVDGGLIEVAPLLTAITAMKGKRGTPFKDMDVLMLGVGGGLGGVKKTPKAYNGLSLLGIATDVIVPYTTLGNRLATQYWGENMGLGSFNYFNPCTIDGAVDSVDIVPEAVASCEPFRQDFLDAWKAWISK